MSNIFFRTISIALVLYISLSLCDERVKFAAVIYRHGDRTPVKLYPTDPWNNESLWPVKFGELTNIGKRQHYAFGKWLRERYSHLLSNKFDPCEINVRSTDVDRTLMSAQSNLAGMYPPIDESIWEPHLLWQPIPVHTVPEKDDEVLAMKKHCQAYDNEMQRLIHSKAFKDRLSKYQNLMNYLSAYTGMKVKDYNDIDDIYSMLYIESLYNFSLPDWTRSVYPNKLREPACYSFRTQTDTPILARLKVGPLMKKILLNMAHAMYEDPKNYLKVSIYSGHDITVANVLNSLNMFDNNCPVYTSAVIMELVYDNSTVSHHIRVLYRNSTEIVEPHALYIPYCGLKCPVERFIKLYENLLTVNWEHDCAKEQLKQYTPVLGVTLVVGLGVFCSVYVAHKVHYARVTRQHHYVLGTGARSTAAAPNKMVEA